MGDVCALGYRCRKGELSGYRETESLQDPSKPEVRHPDERKWVAVNAFITKTEVIISKPT